MLCGRTHVQKKLFVTFQEFYFRASSTVASVAEDFKRMEDAFKAVCALFGENYRDTEPDELFKILADFVVAFEVSCRAFYWCVCV